MKRWYRIIYNTYEKAGIENAVKDYRFAEQDSHRFKMGESVDSPPVEWMQERLKINAEKIKELLEESENMANLLTEHYSEVKDVRE